MYYTESTYCVCVPVKMRPTLAKNLQECLVRQRSEVSVKILAALESML